jgi:hypothetical protein
VRDRVAHVLATSIPFAVGAVLMAALAACAPARTAPQAEIASATPIADIFAPRFELVAGQTAIDRFDPPGAGAGLGLAIATRVANPNDFAITIQRIDFRLTLAGRLVARGVLEPGIEVPPRAATEIAWRVDTDLTEHRELWRAVVEAFAGTPLPFQVDGTVRFASEAYAFTTGSRTLVQGAALATKSVSAPRLRLASADGRITIVRSDAPVISLTLIASNTGDVGYFLSGRDLVLEVNDHVMATIDLGPVPVPAGETSRTDLVFIVDRSRLSAAADGALRLALEGTRGDVRIRGAFVYDVLGVDSYAASIGDGLTAVLPHPANTPDGDDGDGD